MELKYASTFICLLILGEKLFRSGGTFVFATISYR